MKALVRSALCLAALNLSGCYRVVMEAPDPSLPLNLGRAPAGQTMRGSFRTEVKVHHVVSGLMQLSQPEIQAAVRREVQRLGGKGACNLRITHQVGFLDGVIGYVLSLNVLAAMAAPAIGATVLAAPVQLYQPTTVTIEGFVY